MTYSTINTCTLKREILSFTNKFSRNLSRPQRKFAADMTYGILASGSCLMTDIVNQLHERSQKVNSVERLTRNLDKRVPAKVLKSYLSSVRRWVPDGPVIHIDDSFFYYRLAKGVSVILSYAKEGVRLWFWTKRPAQRQPYLKLAA